MKTHKFARKPFYVDAVRVSDINIEEVAEWCSGTVEKTEDGQRYIKVKVLRPIDERQTQAFVGDWVLFAGTGFKVYTPKAFDKSFEKVKFLTKEQADAAGIKPPIEPKQKQRPKRVGHVGQALVEAQAKKAPVPTPPRNKPQPGENPGARIIENARLMEASIVPEDTLPEGMRGVTKIEKVTGHDVEVLPGITLHGVDDMAEESELGANSVQAVADEMPFPQGDSAEVIMAQQLPAAFSNIAADRENLRELTEAEKDANAKAAIEEVLKEG